MSRPKNEGISMPSFFSKLLSMGSDKQLKEFRKIADQVNDLEPQFKKKIGRAHV